LPASLEFFGRMVAPLSAEQLGPLAMSGAGGFFRLGLRRINRLENVSSYTGWNAEEPDSYAEFVEALDLMQALERAGLIDFTYNVTTTQVSSPFDELGEHTSIHEAFQINMLFFKNEDDQWVARAGKTVPYVRFAGSSANDPRALRLRELLNLDPEKYSFPIVDVDFSSTERIRIATDRPAAAFGPEAKFGEIVIVNRSMFEILGIASRSVQVLIRFSWSRSSRAMAQEAIDTICQGRSQNDQSHCSRMRFEVSVSGVCRRMTRDKSSVSSTMSYSE
jgi:hypothetical protein